MDEALICLLEKKDFEYITIKEICQEAGVNRSTFYLHYENTRDLLEETVEYLNEKFGSYFQSNDKETIQKLQNGDVEELIFIRKENLDPYLNFIKDNKRIFMAVLSAPEIFASEKSFKRLSEIVFYPVMERFSIPENEYKYRLMFYIKGIMGIIEEWIKNQCEEPVGFIRDMIIKIILFDEEMIKK